MKTCGILAIGSLSALAVTAFASSQIAVSSPSFAAGGAIPAKFTCKGENQNPPLQFRGIPKEAKSLVLIIDDPDAPGGLFTHWLVWNIDPATTRLAGNSVPTGAAEGTNDFGKRGYGGPCPPSGTHRYYFRVFALDQKLDLQSGATRAAFEQALKNHVLARGELMARFSQ